MKRRGLLKLGVFLLLGAAINVAVAWTCGYRGFQPPFVEHREIGAWPFEVPSTWPPNPMQTGLVKFGLTFDAFAVGDANGRARAAFLCRSGWPLRALQSRGIDQGFGQEQWSCCLSKDGTLAILPIWPGFAINTVFYAAILWGGWLLFAAPFAVRRRLRLRRGQCPHCAYPIGTSDLCTECGLPVRGRRDASQPLAPDSVGG